MKVFFCILSDYMKPKIIMRNILVRTTVFQELSDG